MLRTQGVQREAEALLRRALAANSKDNSIRRALATVVRIQGRDDEANALLDEALQVNPRDALAHLNWAGYYGGLLPIEDGRMENLEKALQHLDAALAIEPFATAIVQKAVIVAAWKGDLATMRATLDRLEELPLAQRSDDRIIFVSMWGGLMERSPDRVLTAAALTTQTYFEDELVAEPASWMLALAHRIAGRENLARQQWQAAEAIVRQRLEESPRSSHAQGELAVTLAWLGRTDEAAEAFSRYDAIMRERGIAADLISAKYYTARGETARAIAVLRQMRNTSAWITDHTLQFDPWWDTLRGQPEFEVLLAENVVRQWVAPRR